jgi:hypothetical protein
MSTNIPKISYDYPTIVDGVGGTILVPLTVPGVPAITLPPLTPVRGVAGTPAIVLVDFSGLLILLLGDLPNLFLGTA